MARPPRVGPLEHDQGPGGPSPSSAGPQAASGPPQAATKPSLAERLAAMEARHSGKAGQVAAAATGPERTEAPPTHEQAQANLEAGLPVRWAHHFRQYEDADGATRWVDERTGETYDKLPELHHADGKPI